MTTKKAIKRKDNKGTVLKDGEFQRKDGRYCYKYKDYRSKTNYIYANTLNELREKENQLQKSLMKGLEANDVNLNYVFECWSEIHQVKPSTMSNYIAMYNKHIRNILGDLKIKDIRYSLIAIIYKNLLSNGLKLGSVRDIHNLLHSIIDLAVKDNLIDKNPCDGALDGVKKFAKPTEKKQALTTKQQSIFFEYIKSSRYRGWLPLFTVLFGTGCRIGEILGLTWNDIDFKNNLISINHTLEYIRVPNEKYKINISTPKTKTSVRLIPMLDEVRKALLNIREFQLNTTLNTLKVDGYTGFIFTNKNGNLYYKNNINNAINNIVNSYNKRETEIAKSENRKPELLPHFSCHIARHSFATRLFENEANIKTISELLGHSNISTTMNIYTDVSIDKKQEAIKEIQGKIKIS